MAWASVRRAGRVGSEANDAHLRDASRGVTDATEAGISLLARGA